VPGRPLIRRPAAEAVTETTAGPPPAAVVLDRSNTLRGGDRGWVNWVRAHDHRPVRTGVLDVWLPPGTGL